MRKIFLHSCAVAAVFVSAMTLGSCDNKKFRVEGTITEATDSVLYFENMSLDGPVVVDSVKLGASGEFSFSEKATEAPEFYRLRIAGQIINVAVDSTENIKIAASYPQMATGYTVEGSEECAVIKELALKQIDLQNKAIAIQKDNSINFRTTRDSIITLVEAYKNDVKCNYIFKSPMRSSSYFALFQTLGNTLIFDPRVSEDDVKVFAAVATSWDTYHPKAIRGKNLHNIAIEGMKNVRIVRNKNTSRNIEASKVTVSNIINVSLRDNKGMVRNLTDLQGKVVMLDFHIFASKESPKRIMQLRELYNKYHAQGFEIYQVSLDGDEHFWKTQTEALPWICVRDAASVQSPYLSSYNIQSIPTYFLVSRNNELAKRDIQIKNVDAEIAALLR